MRFDVAILSTEPVPTIVREVALAERLGYETAWVVDTQLLCRELYVTLTACALATSRIRIGPGVTMPVTRHPAVTASAILSLHELAEGRVVLGVGMGASSVATLGLPPASLAAVEDLVRTCRALMGREAATFDGGVQGRVIWLPRPVPVPIYIAASGPRMLELAGRIADGVLLHCGAGPEMVRAALTRVAAGAAAAGRRLADLDVVVWAPTSIGPDRRLARDHVSGRVASLLRHPLPFELPPEDMAVVRRIREQYDYFEHASAGARHRTLVPDRLIDLLALAGTAADVVPKIEALRRIPEVRRVALAVQAPGTGFVEREAILTTFARDVMPALA